MYFIGYYDYNQLKKLELEINDYFYVFLKC